MLEMNNRQNHALTQIRRCGLNQFKPAMNVPTQSNKNQFLSSPSNSINNVSFFNQSNSKFKKNSMAYTQEAVPSRRTTLQSGRTRLSSCHSTLQQCWCKLEIFNGNTKWELITRALDSWFSPPVFQIKSVLNPVNDIIEKLILLKYAHQEHKLG